MKKEPKEVDIIYKRGCPLCGEKNTHYHDGVFKYICGFRGRHINEGKIMMDCYCQNNP